MNLLEEQVSGGKRGVGEQVQEAQRQEGEDVFYTDNNQLLLQKAKFGSGKKILELQKKKTKLQKYSSFV